MFGDSNHNILASLLNSQILNLENQKRFLKSLTIGHYLQVCHWKRRDFHESIPNWKQTILYGSEWIRDSPVYFTTLCPNITPNTSVFSLFCVIVVLRIGRSSN